VTRTLATPLRAVSPESLTGKAHPLLEVFPALDPDALADLRDDILEHGLRVPITVTTGGVILDGRARFRACREIAGSRRVLPDRTRLAIDVVDLDQDQQAALVLTLNAHRRHLTTGQRALVAARVAKFGSSQSVRAALFGVSISTLKHADTVLRSQDAVLIRAVESGERSVSSVAKALEGRKRQPRPRRPRERSTFDELAARAKEEQAAIRARVREHLRSQPAQAAAEQENTAEVLPIGRRPGSSGEVLSFQDVVEADPCSCDATDEFWEAAVGFEQRRLVSRAHRILATPELTAEAVEFIARKAIGRIPAERRAGFLAQVRLELASSE
jgi:ParB-like chromosome segregation protein Spo0J